MALKPSAPLLRRRAQPGRIPSRSLNHTRKPTAFPLLPMAAATLLLLGIAQVVMWWWEARLPDAPGSQTKSNPFVALPQVLKTLSQPPRPLERAQNVRRLPVVVLPQNLQFGDVMGRVTVTIFTDPSCGACRAQVQALTSQLPAQGVKLVYKFWPRDPERMTPGLLVELARRNGVAGAVWKSIQGAGANDLDDSRMLSMLDSAGLNLNVQRQALTDDIVSLSDALEADLTVARTAKLPPPPVMLVDDYILDGEMLAPQALGEYVQKRLQGRQLLERQSR